VKFWAISSVKFLSTYDGDLSVGDGQRTSVYERD